MRKITWLGVMLAGMLLAACADNGGTPVSPIPTATQPTATVAVSGSPGVSSPVVSTATATLPPTATATIAAAPSAPAGGEAPVAGYRIVATYPHDPQAFTQGLDFAEGVLYEGTGLNGRSSLRRVELETGEILQQIDLAEEFFGEGITILGERIYQLTWQSQLAFVYDLATFEPVEELSYPTDGWGLTTDGQHLIMSDGTNILYYRDPETFAETRRIEVLDGEHPVTQLNELEWVNGEIWANVWQTDTIVRINPATGSVTGWIDLTGLLQPADQGDHTVDVLNGIALDETTGKLYVTGKLWPVLYEIEVVPQ